MHSYIPNPSIKHADPVDVLRLIRTERIGPMTFYQLVKMCGSVKNAIDMAPEISRQGGRKKPLSICPRSTAEREYEAMQRVGAELILYGSEPYPRLLQTIPDAPPALIMKGHTHLLSDQKSLAMVGARNASANGCSFARKLATEIGRDGIMIVSGLARGIDTHAHRAALSTGTVAVIGGGIDTIYPQENEALYHAIMEQGVIITEAPMGTQPMARHFPARNRIIAGMCSGILVVEASLKSGSLITANYALEYGRDVFSVPGSPMDSRTHGSNQLLRDGAIMVESAADVLDHLRGFGDVPLAEHAAPQIREAAPAPYNPEAFHNARALVHQVLSSTPTQIDDIVVATGLSVHYVNAALLELELAGEALRHPDGKISACMEDAA
jgi:DNA processing protein